MASIYKKDKRRKGAPWFVAYTDEAGVRRVVRGCPDKTATEAIARKLESDVGLRRRGVLDPRTERHSAEDRRPLSAHLDDWRADLAARGNTSKHVTMSTRRVQRLVDLAGAHRPSDLTLSTVQAALARLRETGRSLETLNGHVRAIKGFSALDAPRRPDGG